MNGAYTDLGTLYVNLKLKDDATSGLKKASSNIEKIGKSAKEVGNTFSKYITAPLTGLGALAIKEFAGFESSMAKVKAITQATSDEMAILTAKARDLGKNTQFSATEVADAMTYMGMAGWNTTQIMDGLEGVLDLAVASETDLAKVSDIVTDALTGFGMEAKDTQAFVDLLASVSRNANTDVNMLGESFKYVAPIMGGLGVSAEDTAYTLGLMANAGIKGSQAGTSLRQTMLSLVDPTKEAQKLMDQYGLAIVEAEDGSVDLRATLDNLKDGLSGLSEVQQEQVLSTIVGKEASSGLMAVLNAAETDVNKLTDATSEYNGVAKEMAKTMGDTTKGNVNKLKSAFSELLLTVGEELVPIFTKFVEKLTDLVSWFGSLDEGTQGFIVKLGLVAAAAGPVLSTVGSIASGVSGLIGAFGGAGAAAQTLGGTLGSVGTAIGGGSGLLSSLGTLASTLTPNATLYFSPSSDFPRFKLADSGYKRCIKIEKADFVVMGKLEIEELDTCTLFEDEESFYLIDFNRMYFNYRSDQNKINTFKADPERYIRSHHLYYGATLTLVYNGPVCYYHGKGAELEHIMNGDYKKIITDEDLDTTINGTFDKLDKDSVASICDMLDSPDKVTRGLGLKILTGYNIQATPLTVRTMLGLRENIASCSE